MSSFLTFPTYDTSAVIEILLDGVAIDDDVATRAVLWIPGCAFDDETPRIADTDGDGLAFTENNTQLIVTLKDFEIIPGTYTARLTVFDAVNTSGLPWTEIVIIVKSWNSSVD